MKHPFQVQISGFLNTAPDLHESKRLIEHSIGFGRPFWPLWGYLHLVLYENTNEIRHSQMKSYYRLTLRIFILPKVTEQPFSWHWGCLSSYTCPSTIVNDNGLIIEGPEINCIYYLSASEGFFRPCFLEHPAYYGETNWIELEDYLP